MQIGLSIPEGYGIEYADAVETARADGYEFVEVLFDGRARPEIAERVLRPPFDGLGLVVHLPFTVPIWSPIDTYYTGLLETHEACLDAAEALGADAAVVHPASAAMRDAFASNEIITGVIEAIRSLDAYAADRGIELCVENLQAGQFTLDGLEQVIADTDASLVIDTGHARVSGHDIERVIKFFGDHESRITHLHLNDTRGSSDEHLPLGAGTVDFHSLLCAVSSNWEGRVCLESITGDLRYLQESLKRLESILASVHSAR